MSPRCKTCNVELPAYPGAGRPAVYCVECVKLRLRESDNRGKYGRDPWRNYTPVVPESASVITEAMGPDAKAWRLARRERLLGVAEYNARLLARKRAAGIC